MTPWESGFVGHLYSAQLSAVLDALLAWLRCCRTRRDCRGRVERTDLGSGAATLVNAGDPIPPALAHLPRRTAE